MSVLDRKSNRDLYQSRGLLTAIVMIISLAVTFFVMFLSLYFNLERSRTAYYAACRMADFWIRVESIPVTELARLELLPGISELRPRIRFDVTIDLEGVEKPLSGTLISMPADPKPVINDVLIRRGGYFTGIRPDEVIVNDAFARARGLGPGDRLHVLINDRRQELYIVGTAISSEFVYARPPGAIIPDAAGYGLLYVEQRFAEEITSLDGAANEIVGLLTPPYRREPKRVLATLERQLEPYGAAIAIRLADQDSHFQLSSVIHELRTINLIIPTIFMIVAVLILDVLMMRLAEQQRGIVGTLKATGYGNLELMGHYLRFGVVVGTIGGVVGVVAGVWLSGLLLRQYRSFFEFPELVNRPYPVLLAACFGISLFFSALGTLRGVLRLVRLQPAEAMRPRPPTKGRRLWVERFPRLWQALEFSWRMVLRGIARQRIRTLTGIFCALTGAALMLHVTLLDREVTELIRFTFDKMLVSDVELSLQRETDYEALLEARRLPGVDLAEPVFVYACTLSAGHREEEGAITGLLPGARLTLLYDTSGRNAAMPDSGIVLTRELARQLDVEAGAIIQLTPRLGNRRPRQVVVRQIVDSLVGAGAYADFHFLNRLAGEDESLNGIQLLTDPRTEPTRQFHRALKELPRLKGYTPLRDQAWQFEELMEPFRVAVSLMILFCGLLFCGSILTASLISLAERRQEIATFRVLGYRNSEIVTLFLRESFCVNLVGILLGLPVGVVLNRSILAFVANEHLRLPPLLVPECFFWTMFLGLAFTVVANIPVYRAIVTMPWQDALNVKE